MSLYEDWQRERLEGAGPFTSRIVYRLPDGSHYTWTSRRHRKGLGLQRTRAANASGAVERRVPWFSLWAPARLGWWMGVLFMLGSACFALAGFAALEPQRSGGALQELSVINSVFFAGSIFFTTAAYLQLLEAINANRQAQLALAQKPEETFRWFAWQPGRIGWLSAFIQFVGTIQFNISTFDALLPGLGWLAQDVVVWTPDMLGSVCFLASSWLAIMEVCHRYWSWRFHDLSWWIVMVNILGSVAFMVSAVFAVIEPGAATVLDAWLVNLSTCIGALCFLIGAYLLLPELALE
jgi:hypothetical protein